MIYLQVLSVDFDGSPTIVLATEKRRFLFDIGEGAQRLCAEHRVRLVKLDTVFMTRVVPETIAGLPGLFLTAADSGGRARLALVGPTRLQQFWDSLHHFMHRPNFEMKITECAAMITGADLSSAQQPPLEIRFDDEGVVVTCLAFAPSGAPASAGPTHVCYICEMPSQVGRFDVKRAKALGVPPGPAYGRLKNGETITLQDGTEIRPDQVLEESEPGRFCAIICNASSSYYGPLDSANHDDIQGQIVSHPLWHKFRPGGACAGRLVCMVHLSPLAILEAPEYASFLQSFPQMHHFAAGSGACLPLSSFVAATRYSNKLHAVCPSIFSRLSLGSQHGVASHGSALVTSCAPLTKFHLFPPKHLGLELPPAVNLDKDVEDFLQELQKSEKFSQLMSNVREKEKRVDAMSSAAAAATVGKAIAAIEVAVVVAAAAAAPEISVPPEQMRCENEAKLLRSREHRLYFLGTGCAVPSKYRNVSGILLQFPKANETLAYPSSTCMLLDAGEGTWQQMMRTIHHLPESLSIRDGLASGALGTVPERDRTALQLALQLKLVWISHPHADHHLGLIRIIAERKRLLVTYSALLGVAFEPIVIIAPPSVLRFLRDYSNAVQPFVKDSYVPVYCSALDPLDEVRYSPLLKRNTTPAEEGATHDATGTDVNVAFAQRVWQGMGIQSIANVRVEHCNQSYGVSVTGRDEAFKLVYSGDTRPCEALAELGKDATILIHEATFDDDVAEDAVSKRHSTVSEALGMGVRMNAFRVILTHFSQRYPNVPPMPSGSDGDDARALLAFDYMHLSFGDLIWAPSITAALSEAFPPAQEDDSEDALLISRKRSAGDVAQMGSSIIGNSNCSCGCDDAPQYCTVIIANGASASNGTKSSPIDKVRKKIKE